MDNHDIPNEGIPSHEVIGQVVLVGITFYSSTGTLIELFQTHGQAESVAGDLLFLRTPAGGEFAVPFDPNYLKRAAPGTYREKTTGLEIVNPDFLSQWRVNTIDDLEHIERVKERGFSGWQKE